MESKQPKYTYVKQIFKKKDHEVHIIESFDFSSSAPQHYVLKKIISEETPQEIIIHKDLSSSYLEILKYVQHWKEEPFYCLCIEYCKRGDLHQYIRSLNGNPSPMLDVLSWSLQLAETVFKFHQLNICHRDIKPQNIFITEDGLLKIGDFGTCKYFINDESSINTVIGTLPYMSPEQVHNLQNPENRENNPLRDDIYGLGLVFLEMATSNFFRTINKNTNEYNMILVDRAFQNLNYPAQFVQLVKRMLCSTVDSYIKIAEVVETLKHSIEIDSHAIEPIQPGYEIKRSSIIEKGNLDTKSKSNEEVISTVSSLKTTENILIREAIKMNFSTATVKYKIIENSIIEKDNFDSNPEYIEEELSEFSSSRTIDYILMREAISSNFSIVTIVFDMIYPTKTTKKCQFCSNVIEEEDKFVLDCKHYYHSRCLVNLFESKLEKVTKNIDYFRCLHPKCGKINFEKFQDIKSLSTKAKINSTLLYWANFSHICKNCHKNTSRTHLNDKLKDEKIKCPECKTKFCSFCSGSHKFSCDEVSDIKKGKRHAK